MQQEGEPSTFTSTMTLAKMGLSKVPDRYVLPPSQRPSHSFLHPTATLPLIDLSYLKNPSLGAQTINQVRMALIMNDAMDAATEFFNLPTDEKMYLASANVHDPVRYGTSLQKDIEEGSQVMAVNYYPACPQPELALGMPPHTDFGSITILHQNQQGLEIMGHDKKWYPVPLIVGGLIVLLGDQMEVMSNGEYQSPVHRATVDAGKTRISMASIHSLALEKMAVPAPELVDNHHPALYNEGSFSDFLDHLSANDITESRYIDTLKK